MGGRPDAAALCKSTSAGLGGPLGWFDEELGIGYRGRSAQYIAKRLARNLFQYCEKVSSIFTEVRPLELSHASSILRFGVLLFNAQFLINNQPSGPPKPAEVDLHSAAASGRKDWSPRETGVTTVSLARAPCRSPRDMGMHCLRLSRALSREALSRRKEDVAGSRERAGAPRFAPFTHAQHTRHRHAGTIYN